MSEQQADPVEDTPTPYSRPMRLAKHAGIHLLAWLAAITAFAAMDTWQAVSGLGLAGVLSIVTGIIAAIVTTNLVHEWFHFLGAWWSGGQYEIPAKPGLFVYDWDFDHNSIRQFLIMSWAGTVGSIVGIVLIWVSIPSDTAGRAAMLAAAVGALAFAGAIEWPVLRRTRLSGEPFAELSKIDLRVLTRCSAIAIAVGVLCYFAI